jgi:hypothetical protein
VTSLPRDVTPSRAESPSQDSDSAGHRDLTHSRSERQLRRLALREGVRLVVDRAAQRAGLGGFALVDWEGGEIMLGGGLPEPSCDIDEVEDWLLTPRSERESWWAE